MTFAFYEVLAYFNYLNLTDLTFVQTPILWSHGMADRTVLFEAGQAGPPFVEQVGVTCEFKVTYASNSTVAQLDWYVTPENSTQVVLNSQAYPKLEHSINNEELRYLESWIKARLQSSS